MTGESSEMASTSSAGPLRLTLIAALSPSNGLGVSGGLAWSLKGEMAYFRKATSFVPPSSHSAAGVETKGKGKNAVIMGRNTWESIPPKFRPLKGRINVVVSRTTGEEREKELGISASQDAYLVSSLPSAISLLQSFPSAFADTSDDPSKPLLARTFLIGGAQLYAQALQSLTRSQELDQAKNKEEAVLDRMLITRLLAPEHNECDVFLPEYRTASQIQEDATLLPSASQPSEADRNSNGAGGQEQEPLAEAQWHKESHEILQRFLGPEKVQAGIVTEGEGQKETKYEFQLWSLKGQL